MLAIFDDLDLENADAVAATLRAGADACRNARCRLGSIDRVDAEHAAGADTLVATGDLHDNPIHLARLLTECGMTELPDAADPAPPHAHLTLHELIHSDRLINRMDFSYRVLARVARVKAVYPEHVHVLLANHELAQLTGRGIVKDGVNVVEAFDDALDYAFGDEAETVRDTVRDFVRAMPVALWWGQGRPGAAGGDATLCAHSVPAPWQLDRFDDTLLERELTDDDFRPKQGPAYFMTWGHSHTPEVLEQLASRWGNHLFLLGHEKAEHGAEARDPNAVILNSDHERGVFVKLRLGERTTPHEIVSRRQWLAQ